MGSLGLTLAVFTSYQNLVFSPLLCFYMISKRKLDVSSSLAVGTPLLALFLWLLAVYAAYGIFPLLEQGSTDAAASIVDEIKRGLITKTFFLMEER